MPKRDARRELERIETVFAALANASRRQILLSLHFHGGEMTAGEIANRFACSWPTTTRHLRRLEDAGLVHVEKQGRERLYRLAPSTLNIATRWLDTFDTGATTRSG